VDGAAPREPGCARATTGRHPETQGKPKCGDVPLGRDDQSIRSRPEESAAQHRAAVFVIAAGFNWTGGRTANGKVRVEPLDLCKHR